MLRILLVVGLVATLSAFAGCELSYDLSGAWGPSGPAECSGNLPEDDLQAIGRDILADAPLLITQADGDLEIEIVGAASLPPLQGTLSGARVHWRQEHQATGGFTAWSGIVLAEDLIALTQRTEATTASGFEIRVSCAYAAVRLQPPVVRRLAPDAWDPLPAAEEAALLADRMLSRESDRLLLDAEKRDELAGEIGRVLSQIREASPEAADVAVQAPHVPGKLLVALEPALFETLSELPVSDGSASETTAGLHTGRAQFDALNARLGLSAIVWTFPAFRMLAFHFDNYLNVPVAAEAYRGIAGVEFAEPDALLGDGSDIDALKVEEEDAWYVIVRHAWGDCPAGCVNEAFDFFVVDAYGVEEVSRARAAGNVAFEDLADSRGWYIREGPDAMTGKVVIDDGTGGRPPESDPFVLERVRITGDALEAVVSYGGGCREHRFTLVAAGFFRLTDPVSLPVSLVHAAAGDPCEAYLTETYSFDLTPIRNLHGRDEGTIVLLLEGAPDLVYEFAPGG